MSYSQFYFLLSILLPVLNYTSCSRFYCLFLILLPVLNSTSCSQFYFLFLILLPVLNSTSYSQFYFLLSILFPVFTVLLQVRQLDDNFSNTLSLLNKLTARAQEDVTTHNTSPANPTSNPASNPASKPGDARQRTAPLKGRRNKTVSCQTISRPPIKVLQKPPAALKIRLASLNQQVAVLTKAKNRHAKVLFDILTHLNPPPPDPVV